MWEKLYSPDHFFFKQGKELKGKRQKQQKSPLGTAQINTKRVSGQRRGQYLNTEYNIDTKKDLRHKRGDHNHS